MEDLTERFISPQLRLCAESEKALLNRILAPDKEVVTVLIIEYYGSGTGYINVPLGQLDDEKLVEELAFLRD